MYHTRHCEWIRVDVGHSLSTRVLDSKKIGRKKKMKHALEVGILLGVLKNEQEEEVGEVLEILEKVDSGLNRRDYTRLVFVLGFLNTAAADYEAAVEEEKIEKFFASITIL